MRRPSVVGGAGLNAWAAGHEFSDRFAVGLTCDGDGEFVCFLVDEQLVEDGLVEQGGVHARCDFGRMIRVRIGSAGMKGAHGR